MKMKKEVTPQALHFLLAGARTGEDVENIIAVTTEGGIEAQESRGQRQQARMQTLPKKHLYGSSRKHFESLGFVFSDRSDDLFIEVEFPDGWSKEAMEGNSYWSYLLDEHGRRRAMIFYKAAFYDRSAHISLSQRYGSERCYPDYDDESVEEELRMDRSFLRVMDRGIPGEPAGVEIHRMPETSKNTIVDSGEKIWVARNREDKELKTWLSENYPDHKNPLAYW